MSRNRVLRLLSLGLAALAAAGSNANALRVDAGRPVVPRDEARPNVLLIVADDLALGDLSLAGSEIPTPNIDWLARNGVRFTRFYTAASCAPTRAMLLTGVDANVAGLGIQEGVDYQLPPEFNHNPAYAGELSKRVETIATQLGKHGYFTFMAGKWHLGDTGPNGPDERGFERSFIMPHGGASHFDERSFSSEHPRTIMEEDGRPVPFPKPFYSTDFYTDRLIEYVETASAKGQPFFGYAAYTAPHWPLQAPAELIDKHVATYRAGWDEIRARRFAAQQRIGLQAQDAALPPRWDGVPAWASLDADAQAKQARTMATYAAMVERLDSSVGRLLQALRKTGQLDRTIILFMSDNGAAAEDFSRLPVGSPLRDYVSRAYPRTDEAAIGGPDAWAALGRPWAQVSNVAFRLHKVTQFEGGIRSPLIIVDPRSSAGKGVVVDTPWHVTGIAPTILEWLAVRPTAPASAGGSWTSGLPLSRIMAGKSRPIVFASLNSGFVMDGDWKLVRQMVPFGDGKWHLYNVHDDPGERVDLSAAESARVKVMSVAFADYIRDNGLIELPACWNPLANMAGGPDNRNCPLEAVADPT